MILAFLYWFASSIELSFIYHLHSLNISLFCSPRCVCLIFTCICAMCVDSTLVCQLSLAARFLSLSHFSSGNFLTIVRQTVASFSSAFWGIFLPRPGGHTLHKVLRFQLFAVQFSALIFFFLSFLASFSICHFPFSIFYFLLQKIPLCARFAMRICCFVRGI